MDSGLSPTIPPARRFNSVSINCSSHPRRDVLPEHEHPQAYLSFVIDGGYVERVGSRSVTCAAYHVRFHPAGEIHADVFGASGARIVNLVLGSSWNAHIESLGLSDPNDALIVDDGVWPALHAWCESERPDVDSDVVVEEAVATLLERAVMSRRQWCARDQYAIIRRALEFLHDGSTARFSLFDVARATRVHPTHLARTFRRHMGCTIGTYARRLRALKALDYMRRAPRWSLSRIAAEVGFSDHAHLTRVFTRVFGASPSDVRRSLCAANGDRGLRGRA
jgi:AraC family transcriptional regulator